MRIRLCLALGLALFVAILAGATGPAQALSPSIVISQVYGGGGNTGAPAATYKRDFIELFNRGTTSVDVSGWSVQYGSSTGTTWQTTPLSGTIPPGRYYLVHEAQGTGGTVDLPAADAAGNIAMSATAGKVALVSSTTALSGACPLASAVDLVGYGAANCSETAPAPGTNNATADLRGLNGCQETDNNAADFTNGSPNPRNSSSPTNFCAGDAAPSVAATTPPPGSTENPTNTNITVTFSEPVVADPSAFSLTCTLSGNVALTVTPSGASTTYVLDPQTDLQRNETCTVTVAASGVTDVDEVDPPDNMGGNYSFSFSTQGLALLIYQIQGQSHISPYNGAFVSGVPGVITAVRPNSFYMQDAVGDGNIATSDAILVFQTGIGAGLTVGQAVTVSGRVTEFRPGGATSANLTTTEIVSPTVLAAGPGATIAQTIVGQGGRRPPTTVIDDDASGDVETSGTFDVTTDGIDFYESLEAMLLRVNDPVTVGPRNDFGEVWVLADRGTGGAGIRTNRGGIVIRQIGSAPYPNDYRAGDFNPERIQLEDDIVFGATPPVNVNDRFTSAAVGVLDYNFGNFELQLTSALTRIDHGLEREVTRAQKRNELAIATFNVENLDPGDSPAKFAALANLIVNNLRAPDLLAIEEIQDNDGPVSPAPTDASATWLQLIAAIQAAGGPTYDYRQIDPVSNQDGGEPNGNIRVGFLFRTDRGLSFVDRPGGTALTATHENTAIPGAQLTFSPGRVDPTNPAFNNSRKPLAGEFRWRGETLFAVANHFNSKGGDHPLFGRFQPPLRSSEVQRHQQAAIVNAFVDEILAADDRAKIVVLGDINDFEFSRTTEILKGGVLTTLVDTLPEAERYTYVFEGDSQVLDQILVSSALTGDEDDDVGSSKYDIVHVNAEFAVQDSDHDPSVARFGFGGGGDDAD